MSRHLTTECGYLLIPNNQFKLLGTIEETLEADFFEELAMDCISKLRSTMYETRLIDKVNPLRPEAEFGDIEVVVSNGQVEVIFPRGTIDAVVGDLRDKKYMPRDFDGLIIEDFGRCVGFLCLSTELDDLANIDGYGLL